MLGRFLKPMADSILKTLFFELNNKKFRYFSTDTTLCLKSKFQTNNVLLIPEKH